MRVVLFALFATRGSVARLGDMLNSLSNLIHGEEDEADPYADVTLDPAEPSADAERAATPHATTSLQRHAALLEGTCDDGIVVSVNHDFFVMFF